MKTELVSIEKYSELCLEVSKETPQGLFYGYPVGGALDQISAKPLMDCLSDDAVIYEVSFRAAEIKIKQASWLVISGAVMDWTIDGDSVSNGKIVKVKAGQTLKGSYAKDGFRSYVGIDLRKPKKELQTKRINIFKELEIWRGPEWNLLDQECKMTLMHYQASISSESDRQGCYLKGEKLILKEAFPQKSMCTFPGVIQLLPSGELVILLNDGQNTGGYPRVAFLKKYEISKLSQLRPGSQLTLNLNLKS